MAKRSIKCKDEDGKAHVIYEIDEDNKAPGDRAKWRTGKGDAVEELAPDVYQTASGAILRPVPDKSSGPLSVGGENEDAEDEEKQEQQQFRERDLKGLRNRGIDLDVPRELDRVKGMSPKQYAAHRQIIVENYKRGDDFIIYHPIAETEELTED